MPPRQKEMFFSGRNRLDTNSDQGRQDLVANVPHACSSLIPIPAGKGCLNICKPSRRHSLQVPRAPEDLWPRLEQ